MRAHGQTVIEILHLLEELGPMTRIEMCDHLGLDRHTVSSIVSRMAKESPRKPKRIHIKGYAYDHEGQRRYPRAIYALGNAPDARRPKADPKGAKRRYNAKVKALNTANFVFNLGIPRRVYENRKAV